MDSSCNSKNWEVVYRIKDSLATCNIWAPDEAQAEKKFRARKEFEYDGSNEIVLRLSVKDDVKANVERFSKEISPMITSGPPGITGFAGGRPKVQEVISFWPALLDKNVIQTTVDLI